MLKKPTLDEEQDFLQEKPEKENDVEQARLTPTYQELLACLKILAKAKRGSFTGNDYLNTSILSGLGSGISVAGIVYTSLSLSQAQMANLSWRSTQIDIQQKIMRQTFSLWNNAYLFNNCA